MMDESPPSNLTSSSTRYHGLSCSSTGSVPVLSTTLLPCQHYNLAWPLTSVCHSWDVKGT